MRVFYFFYLFILLLTFSNEAEAQLTVVQGAALGMTPLDWVQSQLVGQGVTISNVTFNGSSALITSNQAGSFTATNGAFDQLSLSAGIIMSSGKTMDAIGPNTLPLASTAMGTPGDPDLTMLAGGAATHDAAILEFDFVPVADTLRFQYVFGSEEFYAYCSGYNDCFGFFLSGPGITGPYSNNSINIAKMPGGVADVTISNLCNNSFSQWCNAPTSGNPNCNNPRGDGVYFRYNAFSYVFTAWHIVQPCQVYHIKMAVSDATDDVWDSGVFLQANSFSAAGFTVDNTYTYPVLGNIAIEGCSDATISFHLQAATLLNDTINYTIGGTATNGVDYTTIPTQVIIPAGMDSTFLVITPIMDNIAEGTESIILNIPMVTCGGGTVYSDTVYIQDNFTLTGSVGNDTSICLGNTVTLNTHHTGGQAPYSYLWNTGSTLPQITVTPPLGNTMYYCTISDGCTAFIRDTMIVHVYDHPLITNNVLISTVCTGSQTFIVPQASVGGANYTWTATCSDPNITGYSASAGLTINQILFNTGTTIDTVTYHVTANANGCISLNPKDFKVAVIPSVDAYFVPPIQSVCNGGLTAISILSHTPGTTFSYTFSYGSGNLSGALNGNSSPISQTLFNSGTTTDTVTYHISPMNSGCPGTIYNVKVAVHPVPDAWSVPASQSICSGVSTGFNLFSHVNLPAFTWTATCPSPNVSGYSAGAGASISQLLTNSATTNEIVTYTVTPAANGCPGSPTTIPATVKPSPVMTGANTSSTCSGVPVTIPLQANPAGSLFAWTATGSSPQVTGYTAGAGLSIIQVLSNSGFNIETVTYSVIPTVNGCSGPPANITVTVFPVADVYFTPNGQTICSGTAPAIGLNSHAANPIFTWTATGSSGNVSGFGPGAGNSIGQVLNNIGFSTETVTYHVLPTANSCPGSPSDVTITINPLPSTTFTPCTDIITSTNAQPITLKGGLPSGGTYSGAGVAGGIFSPSVAGTGPHTITYNYLNTYGCAKNATLVITVQAPAAFNCDDSFMDIRDNITYKTISIGSQCWMAENLNYGTTILNTSMQRDNCVVEKYCLNGVAANCSPFGGLYQWDELMQFETTESIQGICPPAWHIPSENEWNLLFGFYFGNGFAASPLKYDGYSGFNAILNGVWYHNTQWDFNTFATFFWSSTAHGPVKAWAHGMNKADPSVSYYPANRSDAFYLRCIKN